MVFLIAKLVITALFVVLVSRVSNLHAIFIFIWKEVVEIFDFSTEIIFTDYTGDEFITRIIPYNVAHNFLKTILFLIALFIVE